MNADLTFNSIVHAKSYDDPDKGSRRRSTARGINTPDDMYIKSQAYTDSETKVPGTRYNVRFDRHALDAEGNKYIVSFYLVLAVPEKAVAGDITAITATFKAAVADASLIAAVLNGEM